MSRARRTNTLIIALAAILIAAAPAPAQSDLTPEQRSAEIERLRADSFAAFDKDDFAAAEAALRALIALDDDDFVPHYNLACALAMQGRLDDAEAALAAAVGRGFANLLLLKSDPHLVPLHDTHTYRSLIRHWDRVVDARIDAVLDAARQTYGQTYTYEKDDALRIAYASAFDAVAFGEARDEIARLAGWWNGLILSPAPPAAPPPPAPPAAEPTPTNPPAPPRPEPWVLVVLPTQPHYAAWASGKYGEGWERIGGSYDHDRRMLICKDLGPTLRHEYWHALHWRDMERRGQRHAIWVMEGLCSLVEDLDPSAPDAFRPVGSWRSNMVKRLDGAGRLMPWKTFFQMPHRRFVGGRPLANYGYARTIFLYLADRGMLSAWYAAYCESFDEDPTGYTAFARAFGRPTPEVERDFRDWLDALPDAPESTDTYGATALPFALDPGAGDGPVIADIPVGSPGRRAGLRQRDVVTAIDNKPIRDISDLIRVLADYEPGDSVELSYRRGTLRKTTSVTLIQNR